MYFDTWIKYREYKFAEHKEKGLYIRPDTEDTDEYNPFEFATEILLDLFNIGFTVCKNMNADEQIIDFVNRFGLLGFGQAIIDQEFEDCDIKLYNGNPFDKIVMHYTDLMDLIFPFERNSHRVTKGTEARATIFLAIHYEYRSPRGCAIFCTDYCEQTAWIENYAKYLNSTLLKFYNDENFEHRLWNAKLYIGSSRKQILKFDSLKGAVDIIFMDLLKSASPEIKLCKRCWKPFVVQSKKTEFCSPSCRNVFNVKKSRKRRCEEKI